MTPFCGLINENENIYEVDFHRSFKVNKSCYILSYLHICGYLLLNNENLKDELAENLFIIWAARVFNSLTKVNETIDEEIEKCKKAINDISLDNCILLLEEVKKLLYTHKRIELTKNLVKEAANNIKKLYDQTFLRYRFGGMYFTNEKRQSELYFRVASKNVDWFNVIWNFVYKNKNMISTVTISRDELACNDLGFYVIDGKIIDKMPVDEFITLPGNPEINMNFKSEKIEEFKKYTQDEWVRNLNKVFKRGD